MALVVQGGSNIYICAGPVISQCSLTEDEKGVGQVSTDLVFRFIIERF